MATYKYVSVADPAAPNNTGAQGINDNGQIVGFYVVIPDSGPSLTHGFLRNSDGSYTTIDDPLGNSGTEAFGINASGQIVGHYNTYDQNTGKQATHGFL